MPSMTTVDDIMVVQYGKPFWRKGAGLLYVPVEAIASQFNLVMTPEQALIAIRGALGVLPAGEVIKLADRRPRAHG